GQDGATLFNVVAVQADNQWLVRCITQGVQRANDAVCNSVTCGDATEDVDEDRLDLWVIQDDVKAVSHDLSRCATTNVKEVGRLDRSVVLASVGNNVQGRHNQASTVTDDAYFAVQLDVVQASGLCLCFQWIGCALVL